MHSPTLYYPYADQFFSQHLWILYIIYEFITVVIYCLSLSEDKLQVHRDVCLLVPDVFQVTRSVSAQNRCWINLLNPLGSWTSSKNSYSTPAPCVVCGLLIKLEKKWDWFGGIGHVLKRNRHTSFLCTPMNYQCPRTMNNGSGIYNGTP